MDYKKLISDLIEEVLNINVYDSIEIPPDSNMGDFAFPCFKLAKELRKSPQSIAEDLKSKLSHESISKIEVVGAYLNFFIDKSKFSPSFEHPYWLFPFKTSNNVFNCKI